MAHSRMQQYERLLAFVTEQAPKGLDRTIFASALVHDCYLRENCKSRPSFAREEGLVDKDTARNFYPVDVLQLQAGTVCRKPVTLLYDYRNREPFHHDGRVWNVTSLVK